MMHDPVLSRIEARSDLIKLLNCLSPQKKQIITMRFINGMTQRESAKKLGITRDQFVSAEKQTLKILRITGAKTKISRYLTEYLNEIS